MSLARKAVLAACCVGLVGVPDAQAAPKRDTAAQVSTGRAAQDIIRMTNRERVQRGLPALRIDGRCVAAISSHVADMARGGFLSHEGRDGRGADQRFRRYSPSARGAGENLAYNYYGTGQSFMQQWLGSSGHRENILSRSYKGIGVAVRANCASRADGGKCTYYAGQCFSQ
jgi:uncharacterized protein YkwD